MDHQHGRFSLKRLFLVLSCLLLSACTAGSNTQTSRLVIGQGREFNSLLAMGNNGFTSSELINLTSSLLVTLGPEGYAPDAAVSVPSVANGGISRDGLTITYHLRHGMHWQDGKPLTARDVLFTQTVVMSPRSLAPIRDGFDRVRTISAPDPYTVVVTLKHPYRLFVLDFLGPESVTGILPEHLLAHVADISRSTYASMPVGSGPYRIVRWQHGDSVTFAADPHWYGGSPAIKEIVVRFIPDPTTRLTQLRTHEIDAELNTSTDTAQQARSIPGYRVDAEITPAYTELTFNLHAPVVSRRAVRLAIAQAIDTQTIAQNISRGLLSGRDGARGLFLWAYDPHAGYPVYDPQAAKRRLDAAGWHLGSDGIRRDSAGQRLAFTIALRASRADDTRTAAIVQQQLRAIGIDAALKTYSDQLFTANDGFLSRGQFSAELSNYYANIEPDPSLFYACASRGLNGFNESGYCDPATDADISASLATTDRHVVATLMSRVQRRLNAEMPTVFFWQAVDTNVVPAKLRRFFDLLGEPFANAGSWTL
jgi:peptide/nickel transport system substrate-binding protein